MIARAFAVTLALLLVGGCQKSSPETPAAGAIKKLVAFRDQACACTDRKCMQVAQRDLKQWLLAHGAEFNEMKFTPAQDAVGKKANDDMAACVAKLNQSAAPTN